MEAHKPPVEGRGLGDDSNVTAPNAAISKQPAGDKLCSVDANGKAQSLRQHDGGRVHTHDSSIASHQRPAGIARIEGSVGLNDIIDQSPGF